jgi:YggT family protein
LRLCENQTGANSPNGKLLAATRNNCFSLLIQRARSANRLSLFSTEKHMLLALISILGYLMTILSTVVIVQFILSLLIAFNVVSLSNNIVASIWHALNMILDPFLKPIRKIMPDTGMIDFSPMVLLIGLRILQMLLMGLANDIAAAGM